MSFALKSLTVILVAMMSYGCGSGSGDSATLPSTTPGNGGGEVGQVTDDFYIGVANNVGFFEPFVYQTGSFGTACEISGSVTLSNAAMSCTIDILEVDNYVHQVDIQYNVPQDSCEYVVVSPSWHWNFSAGYGPSSVTIEKDSQGNITDVDSSGDGGCRVAEAGAGVICANAVEVQGIDTTGPICEYNHTSRDKDQPNCCFGSYTLTEEVDTDDNGTKDSIRVIDNMKWGGNAANCIGGSARTSWPETNYEGIPQSLIYYVSESGRNDVIEIQSNAANMASSFQYGANHYNTAGSPHSHTGYYDATVSTVPYAFDPVDDLDGSSMSAYSPRAPYTLTCLNRGGEIKHVINIYVREWNTYFQWLTYQSSLGTSGDPDLRGAEGVACEFESAFGGSCNDYSDWDDLLFNATGGTYDTSTPNAVERRSWFPQVIY